jgi:cysteinyl-tRNA synthetase
MIEMIEGLLSKGYAYETADGVYYRISAFGDYGRLAHIDRSALMEGASGRIDSDEYAREQVSDFALWKKWTPDDGEVKWDSPFGSGRPGWHIECSVMSMKLLGNTIDIHCGGIDNLFPHHENEKAQSEAYTGVKFVNYWMHSAHLLVDGEKMSKSKGNFYTLDDIAKMGHSPRAVRYALIGTHYRKPLNFTRELLKQSDSSLKRIDDFLFDLEHVNRKGKRDGGFRDAIEEAMSFFADSLDDDLNIAEALSALFGLISYYYERRELAVRDDAEEITAWIKKTDEVLGILEFEGKAGLSPEEEGLIEERRTAREKGDYKRADEIRMLLLEKGVLVRDTKEGMVWKRMK